MQNLKINQKPIALTKHYSGTYFCNSQWEDEITTEGYDFTVEVTTYSEGETEVEDIVWETLSPRDEQAAYLYIDEHLLDLIAS